jgi:hypothetical protein
VHREKDLHREVISTTRASIAVSAVMALVAAALAMVLGLSAAGASEGAPERTRPATLEGSSIAWCGDIQPVRAEPEAYQRRPGVAVDTGARQS